MPECMTIHTQYIQPGSLTQKYEAFRPLFFTWQDSSAGAMVGKLVLPRYEKKSISLYHQGLYYNMNVYYDIESTVP